MTQFKPRRLLIQRDIKENEAFLVQQPKSKTRNHDVHYPFHPNRYFYYLTGFTEPNAWLLITRSQTILWSQNNDPTTTLWEGPVLAQSAKQALDIDAWHDIATFNETLSQYMHSIDHLHLIADDNPTSLSTSSGSLLLDTNRVIKDKYEIENIRSACRISANAHNQIMRYAKRAKTETAIEGRFIYEVMKQGSQSQAYPSIVASGKNACILHYTQNNQALNDGDLILIDAGCEFEQYASDITRTFPKSGKFTKSQRAVYEAVLATQVATINHIKPGISLSELNDYAAKLITEHLIELKVISESFDTAYHQQLYRKYFPHNIGHTMGLDVHDISPEDDTLKPGMCITVEPGLYFNDSPYSGIGVRIEDNILITTDGYENLTIDAVKTVADIEHLMA